MLNISNGLSQNWAPSELLEHYYESEPFETFHCFMFVKYHKFNHVLLQSSHYIWSYPIVYPIIVEFQSSLPIRCHSISFISSMFTTTINLCCSRLGILVDLWRHIRLVLFYFYYIIIAISWLNVNQSHLPCSPFHLGRLNEWDTVHLLSLSLPLSSLSSPIINTSPNLWVFIAPATILRHTSMSVYSFVPFTPIIY